MASSRVVRVRPADGGGWRRRCCVTASPRSSASSRSVRSSRPRWRRPPLRRSRNPRLPDLDRTDLPMVTIDPAGAKDLDQALYIARDRRRRLRPLLRDRRPGGVHHPRRPGRRGVAQARPDAVRRRQPDPAASDLDLRGRWVSAARPAAPGVAVDDHDGRRGSAHRRRGGAGAGAPPGPARLPRRAAADRRRHRRRVPDAPQGARASSGSSASRPVEASRCRCPSRRSARSARSGSSPIATSCRSRSGTPRCRCSPASPRRR